MYRRNLKISLHDEIFRRIPKIAKLRSVNISFIMSVCLSVSPYVCPSVRMEQLRSHWTDFNEIWFLFINPYSVEKIQVSLKSYKNNVYFTWTPIHIFDHISLSSY
jgi:hypothetical protein